MISDMNTLADAAKIEIRTYSEIISAGGVIAFPTETVYGLGASAWNPSAIARVFELKGRPSDNPLIVHISNYGMLLDFASEILPESRQLMQKFWPGPLTLIFEKKDKVLDSISAGLNSVALRIPDHAHALKLIDLAGPLVAPSANLSGSPSPTKAEHVKSDFGNSLPILDGGECTIGIESTVIDVRKLPFVILRPGRITSKMIKDTTGLDVIDHVDSNNIERPVSPGMKYSHYAPKTPIMWINTIHSPDVSKRLLFLVQDMPVQNTEHSNIIYYNGDLDKMARELFDWFRKGDIDGYDAILIEKLEKYANHELYGALCNRISKALAKH
jgi:L-threonylcarbamoyladenylate synthase